MSETLNTVAELSRMKRALNASTLEALRGPSEKYAERLKTVADKTFMNGRHVGGTTIGRPSVLSYSRRGRLIETCTEAGFGMYVRNIPTPEGVLTMFPLHTLGISAEGVPIIDPTIEGSYSVVHIPHGVESDLHNPAGMRVDLAFTVDRDNLVTTNGQNTASVQEYELFDAIVTEFERRAEL
jgi:hypothetical protein